MNRAILMGRLTRDPELKTTASNISVCSFTLAVDRRYKNSSGDRETDFINCVAWRQQAELISKWFHKGERMLVSGSLQSRNWEDQQGNRRTSMEVIVDEIDFINSSRSEGGNSGRSASSAADPYSDDAVAQASKGVFDVSDTSDTDLPFDL